MSSSDAVTWVARDRYDQPSCVGGAVDPFFNDALPCPAAWSPDVNGGRLAKEVWAPGVARIGDRYVMFYAAGSTPKGRFCLSVATASDGLGPFTDSTTTPIHCDDDPNGSIDPQPFVDPTTGVPYLLWKSEGFPGRAPARLWVRQLAPDGTSWAPGSTARLLLGTSQSWEGNVVENPSMIRYGGRWLLFYSGNEWRSDDYATGVAFCDSPLGPCRKSAQNPILRSEGDVLGPGGGTAFVDAVGSFRFAHHYWRAPHVGYPSDPGCDGTDPKTGQPHCASQGQRRMRVAWVILGSGDRVTVSSTPPPSPAARNIDSACPPTLVPRPYADVPPDSTHARAVSCMTAWGVTTGTGPATYVPNAPVTREQMASFVARLVERTFRGLPPEGEVPDAFTDDEGSGHEGNINRLAAAGIVGGTGGGRYSPLAGVPREQMASFLARAATYALRRPLPPGGDAFWDDGGSVHQANIEAMAALGVSTGTGPGAFRPEAIVSRAQMAGFLARLADVFVDDGQALAPAA
jgi:hypothetical protein